MRLARGRAGWALTAAGTIGLTVAAAAHGSPNKPLTAMPLQASAATAMAGGLARVVEIRVELAWLADPHTFPYDLAARGTGSTLEVGGLVPDAAVRDRALQVARENSPLPVVDRLLIQPGAGNPPTKMGDGNLCRAAGEALSRMLAGHNEPFQVAADPSGQVTLLGTVQSCEDKLRVSRRMSQLPGCTSVLNSMVVARTKRDGQIYTTVSADGSSVVAGDPLDLLPPPAVSVPARPEVVQAPYQQNGPSLEGSIVSEQPARIVPSPSQSYTPARVAPPKTQGPVQPVMYQVMAPVPVAQPISPYGGAVQAPRYQYAAAASPAVSPYAMRPVAFVQPNPLPTAMVAAPVASQPAQAMPAAPSPIMLASATAIPNGGAILLVSAQQPESRPAQGRPGLASKFGANKTPAKNAAQPVKSPPSANAADKPKDTANTKPLTANQTHIKRLIEVACGDAAREVELRSLGENRLTIALKVRSAGEGQRLGERILLMPELEPYKVDLEMEVKQ